MTKTRPLHFFVAFALLAPLLGDAHRAQAQGAPAQGFGLGIQVGATDGLSAKWWLNERNALQFGFGFGLDQAYFGRAPLASVDYLWHPSMLAQGPVVRLLWHIGVGGEVGFGEAYYRNAQRYSSEMGARGPVGLDLLFNQQPIDVFIEAAPTFVVIPYFDFVIEGNLGARYYF